MKLGIDGKTVVITGAAQGIGKATAEVFAEEGAELALVDLKAETLEKTVRELKEKGVRVQGIVCDVSKEEQVAETVKKVVAEYGKIDVLVNCAGITNSSLLYEIDSAEWDRVMNINCKSVYMMSQRVAKIMIANKTQGSIISVSSQASKLGEYGNGVYSCSKAMINMFTQVLALELAQFGITVNAVCPGYVDTVLMQRVFQERGPIEGMTPEEYEKHLLKRVPLGRMVQPKEIGEYMAFLTSQRARYITGTSQTIAGGSIMI